MEERRRLRMAARRFLDAPQPQSHLDLYSSSSEEEENDPAADIDSDFTNSEGMDDADEFDP